MYFGLMTSTLPQNILITITTIYCIGPNVEYVISNLNSVMDQISLWSMRNKLIIHPANTEAMILRTTPFIGPI